MRPGPLKCEVYKGARKENTYLFVADAKSLETLPPLILKQMGELEFVLSVDLSTRKTLAVAEPAAVIECIERQGFYPQLPPGKEPSAC